MQDMDNDELFSDFEREMYKIYREAYTKCKHNAHIFNGMPQDYGGVVAAKRLLSQHGLQYGFEKLCQRGCPDITMESLILHRPWNRLFTKKKKEVAIARLKTFGYEFDHGEIIDLEDEG